MEKFEVNILGCGSAKPTLRHNSASQIINIREKLFMVDCGEGTQLQMIRYGLSFSRLNHIFISHLHGDHCFGLIGLISTMGMLRRTSTLHIYAHKNFRPVLNTLLDSFCREMSYSVELHTYNPKESQKIYDDRSVSITTIPLNHRLPCCGFLFEEKQPLPHIKREMIDFYKIPFYAIQTIKEGADWETADGKIISHESLTYPSYKPRSYAYCSDTAYKPDIVPIIKGVDLLFHEATFGEDRISRAKETLHSTASQAASIAQQAEAKQLLIGHFSARFNDEAPLLEEAKAVFDNTILAYEGLKIKL